MQLTAQDFAPTNQPPARHRRAVRCRPGHGLAAYDGSNPHMHGLGFLKKIKKAAKKVVSAPLKIASTIAKPVVNTAASVVSTVAKPVVSVAAAPANIIAKPLFKNMGRIVAKPKPALPAIGAGAAAGGATVYAGGGGGLVPTQADNAWESFYSSQVGPSIMPKPLYLPTPPPVYSPPAAPTVVETFTPSAPPAPAPDASADTGGGSILPGVDNRHLMIGAAALLALVALKR